MFAFISCPGLRVKWRSPNSNYQMVNRYRKIKKLKVQIRIQSSKCKCQNSSKNLPNQNCKVLDFWSTVNIQFSNVIKSWILVIG